MTKKQQRYRATHNIGKIVRDAGLVLISFAMLYAAYLDSMMALAVINIVQVFWWNHSTNIVAYYIEARKGWAHQHPKW